MRPGFYGYPKGLLATGDKRPEGVPQYGVGASIARGWGVLVDMTYMSSVSVTATTALTNQVIFTTPSMVFDGDTRVLFTHRAPKITIPAAQALICIVYMDGTTGTDLSWLEYSSAVSGARSATICSGGIYKPPAGSHYFTCGYWVTGGSGTVSPTLSVTDGINFRIEVESEFRY